MGTHQQMMLVSDVLRSEAVEPEWFSPVCTVTHVMQLDDGVRLRPDQIDRSPGSDDLRRAAEIAFEHCPDIDFFIYTNTQNTVMTTEAYLYEMWDGFDEPRVELVMRMYTGENNWQEPFRYFSDVHGITVRTVDPDWPPRSSQQESCNMTAGQRERD
jgi:hypothetical protein